MKRTSLFDDFLSTGDALGYELPNIGERLKIIVLDYVMLIPVWLPFYRSIIKKPKL